MEKNMSTIFQTYINALLADATYALGNLNQGDLTGASRDWLVEYLSERMTPEYRAPSPIVPSPIVLKESNNSLVEGWSANEAAWKEAA
jgi:hypothetical protein